jgi:hypothetical protein
MLLAVRTLRSAVQLISRFVHIAAVLVGRTIRAVLTLVIPATPPYGETHMCLALWSGTITWAGMCWQLCIQVWWY